MKNLIITALTLTFSFTYLSANGQNFKAELKKLDADINAAYKRHKLTDVEYGKLQNEHDIIRLTIDKAMADGYMSADEKNRIHSKIIRSKKRFAKYKINREVY